MLKYENFTGAIVCGKPICLTNKMGGLSTFILNYPKAILVVSGYLANSIRAVYYYLEPSSSSNTTYPFRGSFAYCI